MIIASLAAVVVVALASWIVAVMSALAIVGLAPRGQKLRAYFALGWWRFQKVEEIAGPECRPHIARYRLAFFGFFGCILLTAITVFLLTIERQN